MNNNLRNIEKALKSLARKCKEIKYSRNLLFAFLLSGSFSSYGSEKRNDDTGKARKQLENSIDDIKHMFKKAKKENTNLLKKI